MNSINGANLKAGRTSTQLAGGASALRRRCYEWNEDWPGRFNRYQLASFCLETARNRMNAGVHGRAWKGILPQA